MPLGAAKAALLGAAGSAGGLGAGYWAGGYIGGTPNSIKQISKLLYVDDSCAAITPVLTYTNYELGGYANAGVSGYWVGGRQDGSGTLLTLINKTDFDDDSTSTASGSLDDACRFFGGLFANSGTAGYSCGGSPSGGRTDAIEKLLFADDSCGAITPVLSQTTRAGAGCANSGTAGYWAGGAAPLSDVIDKTAFSDDSTAAITPTLAAAVRTGGAAGLTGTAAYWGGGSDAVGYSAEIDKTDFSDDSTAAITADLATANSAPAACSNDAGL